MDTKRLARFSRPGHGVTGERFRTAKEKRSRVGCEHCHSIIDDTSAWPPPRSAPTKNPNRHRLRRTGTRVLRGASHHAPARANRQCVVLRPQPQPPRAAHPTRAPAPPGPATNPEAQTGRSSATSNPSRANGPTGSATATQTPAPTRCPVWLMHYNATRNHSSLQNRPPTRSEPTEAQHLGPSERSRCASCVEGRARSLRQRTVRRQTSDGAAARPARRTTMSLPLRGASDGGAWAGVA
jgi:hypothetical protein